MVYFNKRVGQVIPVNGQYSPSKISLFLNPTVSNSSANYFNISEGFVADASNFIEIEDRESKVMFDFLYPNYTGMGYMSSVSIGGSLDFSILKYNVFCDVQKNFKIWFRGNLPSGVFKLYIYLNGMLVDIINEISTPSNDWIWSMSSVDIDEGQNELSLQIIDGNLDKIYFSFSEDEPSGEGPQYTLANYFNVHVNAFKADSLLNIETNALKVYGYKNSFLNIKKPDWYNFNIDFLDDTFLTTIDQNLVIFLSSSGTDILNKVSWETVDVDEYNLFPVIF